ncbi:MAG: organic solvent tolerance protein OstA [Blastopirellula sp.]|nr:MAG: organic solvent tolerance protein OstA [Blastopirellula sp.]
MRTGRVSARRCLFLLALVFIALCTAQDVQAEIDFPEGESSLPIQIEATHATFEQKGDQEVWQLSGACRISQGGTVATAEDAVLWIDYSEPFSALPHKVTVYLEGEVVVSYTEAPAADDSKPNLNPTKFTGPTWMGYFFTSDQIKFPKDRSTSAQAVSQAIYQRGSRALPTANHLAESQPAPITNIQYQENLPSANPLPQSGQPNRRVQIFSRYSTGYQILAQPNQTEAGTILMLDSGVNILIQGLSELDTVNILADRIVLWSKNDVRGLAQGTQQTGTVPVELYLEGNIVFRQGDQVVYADRMYYNVADEYGMILDAELLAPVPGHQGLLRLKAEVLQKVNRTQYLGYKASLTTSRLGVPRYWFQSNQIEFEDIQTPIVDPFSGQQMYDPISGDPLIDHERLATSRGNLLYFGGLPVFYWPTMAANLETPGFYLNSAGYGNDDVFGTQITSEWDNYQLLGIRNPWEGTTWDTSIDYYSERGLALGTHFDFNDTYFPLMRTPATGYLDAWGINDDGFDNLGRGRRMLTPEEDMRGRIYSQYRQTFLGDWQYSSELGYITDRNFLESYFESEWDNRKDQTTGFELKRLRGNRSFAMSMDSRLNDFFMETEWLPRVDHYWLGQSLLFDKLTYYSHASLGYARLLPASTPTDPDDAVDFDPLPYEVEREGVRAVWRQEVDLPFEIGPTKAVPYALGELGYWGQDIDGNDISRAYGQLGVRNSLLIWSADHGHQSRLWNLNGLAHKVTFFSDISYTDSSQDMDQFPLYDNIDDNAQEHFQRRLKFNTYGLPAGTNVPLEVDPRYFAARYGMQGSVASPVAEIAEDMTVGRFEIRQRWQTKRGPRGAERIIDWISFDAGASVFPDSDRDNYGESLGLVNYDFNWEVGNRLTVVSNGYWDFFDGGLQTMSVGGFINRPQVGYFYLGYTNINEPFQSHIMTASLQYRMTEKWLAGLASSYDFNNVGDLGQRLSLTRIGESSLISMQFNVDPSRDNVSIGLNIEPRFFARSRYSTINGEPLPPLGAFGIE